MRIFPSPENRRFMLSIEAKVKIMVEQYSDNHNNNHSDKIYGHYKQFDFKENKVYLGDSLR